LENKPDKRKTKPIRRRNNSFVLFLFIRKSFR
jgi:nitrate reductase NapE component